MSTIPLATPRVLTYARARLFLGTSAVGTLVVLSALALVLDLPGRFLPTAPGAWPIDAAWIALVVALHVAVLAPFDLFAGLLVPREYGRTSEPLGRFLGRWARGAVVHGVALVVAGTALMLAARAGGGWGAVAAFLGLSLALLAWQPLVAAAVGSLRFRRAADAPSRDLGPRTLVADTAAAASDGRRLRAAVPDRMAVPGALARCARPRRPRPAGRAAARDPALGRARPRRPAGARLERVAAAAGPRAVGRAGRRPPTS